jgi:putative transposase
MTTILPQSRVKMIEEYKTYVHTPPHLYRPGAKYFITALTYRKIRLFDDKAKEKLFLSLLKACENYGWKLEDWVILENHYHIMLNAPKDKMNLPRFVSEYHKFTALFIKKNNPETIHLPKIFSNYWDTCISYERSYYARLNYIFYNPVKHGYVQNAEDYKWGSFYIRYREDGAYMERLWKEFPFDGVNIKDDY